MERRPVRSCRQANLSPAQHRPGAHGARRLDGSFILGQALAPARSGITMLLASWLRKRFAFRKPARRALLIEALEDRTLPSVDFHAVGISVPLSQQVLAADFNADGHTDMVVVNSFTVTAPSFDRAPGGLTVLMNDANHPSQFSTTFTY